MSKILSRRSLLVGAATSAICSRVRTSWADARGRHVSLQPGAAAGAINAALQDNEVVMVPAGSYTIADSINIPEGRQLIGDGSGSTRFLAQTNSNLVHVFGRAHIQGITINGAAKDDTSGGSGLIFAESTGSSAVDVVAVNCSKQGIAVLGGQGNMLSNCAGYGCGHRALNITGSYNNKKGSSLDNVVNNFKGLNCKRSGLLLGHGASRNHVSNVEVGGCGAGDLWIDVECNDNLIQGVKILPRPRVVDIFAQHIDAIQHPSFLVGANVQGNRFIDFDIEGVGLRGIWIWNQNPDVAAYSSGPTRDNNFVNFRIVGSNFPDSFAIGFSGDPTHLIEDNIFRNFYVDGFEHVAKDTTGSTRHSSFPHLNTGQIRGVPFKL